MKKIITLALIGVLIFTCGCSALMNNVLGSTVRNRGAKENRETQPPKQTLKQTQTVSEEEEALQMIRDYLEGLSGEYELQPEEIDAFMLEISEGAKGSPVKLNKKFAEYLLTQIDDVVKYYKTGSYEELLNNMAGNNTSSSRPVSTPKPMEKPKETDTPISGASIKDLTGYSPELIYISDSKYNGKTIKKGKWIREDGRAVLFIDYESSNSEFAFESFVLADRYNVFQYASSRAKVDAGDSAVAYDALLSGSQEFKIQSISDGSLEITTNETFRTWYYDWDFDGKLFGRSELPDGKYYFVR